MNDPSRREEPPGSTPCAPPQPGHEANAPASDETRPASELTPEEQMARFEAALKEEDWGHQPC